MDRSNASSSTLASSGGLVVLFGLVLVNVLTPQPYESTRPREGIPAEAARADATGRTLRLWEDPFDAPCSRSAGTDELVPWRPEFAHGTTRIVYALVPGGRFEGDREQRMRWRTALVSAITAADYLPDDAHPLRVVEFGPLAPSVGRAGPLDVTVAVERFEPQPATGGPALVCAWIGEENLAADPLRGLLDVRAALAERGLITQSPLIVGPNASTTLRAMIDADRTLEASHIERLGGWSVLSPTATVDGAELDWPGPDPHRCTLPRSNLPITRTIGTDRTLLALLLDEVRLRSRRVRPALERAGAHDSLSRLARTGLACFDMLTRSTGPVPRRPLRIALVAERDSLYGRSWRELLEQAATGSGGQLTFDSVEFSRGIDGQSSARPAITASAPSREGGQATVGSLSERAWGTSQADYLRRLSDTLAARGTRGVDDYDAVLVVASDVYDKILILQALRPRLPNTLFLTTDLDARLLDRTVRAACRNVIVASHYGIRPVEAARGETSRLHACFRDGYQTSVHECVSAWLAGRNPASRSTGSAIVFEIGRDREYPLREGVLKGADDGTTVLETIGDRSSIAPTQRELFWLRWPAILAWLVPLCSLGACILMIPQVTDAVRRAWRSLSTTQRVVLVTLALATTGLGLHGLCSLRNIQDDALGEPFFLFAGISAWPTEVLRVVAIVASVVGVAFVLGRSRALRASIADSMKHARGHQRVEVGKILSSQATTSELLVSAFALSAGAGVAEAFVFAAVAPGPHLAPTRGVLAADLDLALSIASLASVQFLVFVIVCVVRLWSRVIATLTRARSNLWKPAWSAERARRFGLTVGDGYTLELYRITARVVREVDGLVIVPSIVLAILAVSRSDVFDHWTWSVPLILSFVALVLCIASNIWVLRHAVGSARARILEHARPRLLSTARPLVATRSARQAHVRRVEKLPVDFFSGVLEHPLFRSALLPFAGLSVGSIVELLESLRSLY